MIAKARDSEQAFYAYGNGIGDAFGNGLAHLRARILVALGICPK